MHLNCTYFLIPLLGNYHEELRYEKIYKDNDVSAGYRGKILHILVSQVDETTLMEREGTSLGVIWSHF